MINWFRQYGLKNRPYFRYVQGLNVIEGYKNGKALSLKVKIRGELVDIKVDEESTDKIINWLCQAFPSRNSNVIPLDRKLPVQTAPRDPGPGPRNPGQ